MTDPQFVCPSCRAEIKLTESLAAPLIAETRRKFDEQLAAKEADFGRREELLKQASEEIAKARARRARLAIADELGERDRESPAARCRRSRALMC